MVVELYSGNIQMLKTHKPSPFMFIFLLLHVLTEATILGGREQREESREQSMVS